MLERTSEGPLHVRRARQELSGATRPVPYRQSLLETRASLPLQHFGTFTHFLSMVFVTLRISEVVLNWQLLAYAIE